MEDVEKLEFNLKFDGESTLKNLKLEIKVNGKIAENYKYDEINIYKITSDSSYCNLSDNIKLENNYILLENETYGIEIKELSFSGMVYDSMIWQGDGYVFINGKAINEYEDYCMGTEKEEGTSESFAFSFPSEIIKTSSANEKVIENNETIQQQTNSEYLENNETIQQQTNSEYLENNNSNLMPIMSGAIGILIIVIIILTIKLKKNKIIAEQDNQGHIN